MVTVTINGHEYRLSEYLSLRAYKQACAHKTDDGAVFLDSLIATMMLDEDGNKFESEDAALDTVRMTDYAELGKAVLKQAGLDEVEGADAPLPEKKDSDAG